MKTLIKSLALTILTGIATTSFSLAETKPIVRPTAAASFKTGVYSTPSGKLHISLDKQTGGTVDVRLKDAKGTVLYSERLGRNETRYRTRLDLSELENGTYELEMTNGVETTRQTVVINAQQQRIVNIQLLAAN
ncbi:T9SS type A sorting domain-containing protein [Spirosoma sordidisoli]|uniref:Secretion system C-terminal sorting domain-containing protein n=1 Tax=Spirosoma sordidisoli TaxID=2502893 RepID=A0A4Q2UQF3_9BACT|nr:hypothetical protein [Spirosoma sordidisoli]RYC71646.1 hypothetical protein EQG79_05805 [Spirosoma sordidisoli]